MIQQNSEIHGNSIHSIPRTQHTDKNYTENKQNKKFKVLFLLNTFLRQLNGVFPHNVIIRKTEEREGFVPAADLSGVFGQATVGVDWQKIPDINLYFSN